MAYTLYHVCVKYIHHPMKIMRTMYVTHVSKFTSKPKFIFLPETRLFVVLVYRKKSYTYILWIIYTRFSIIIGTSFESLITQIPSSEKTVFLQRHNSIIWTWGIKSTVHSFFVSPRRYFLLVYFNYHPNRKSLYEVRSFSYNKHLPWVYHWTHILDIL